MEKLKCSLWKMFYVGIICRKIKLGKQNPQERGGTQGARTDKKCQVTILQEI